MTENSQKKDLTAADRSDRIWSKLKAKAATLENGRIICELTVYQRHIRKAEISVCKEEIR